MLDESFSYVADRTLFVMCVARIVSFLVGHVCVPDCAACFVSRWCMGWERKENDDMHIVLYFSIARHLHGVKNRKLRGAFCLCFPF